MLRRVPVSKTLCASLLAAALLLLGVSSAQAAPSPDSVVEGFYRTYMKEINTNNGEHWVERLVKAQRAHLDPALAARLLEIAGNPPGTDKPWLDFDPFSNSQMGTRRYEVLRAVAVRNGTCLVPVALQLNRESEPPKLRIQVALAQCGGAWVITNFLYPAEAGMKAWDLQSILKDELGH